MIIDKFKNILKNHPDKTAILFKEKGRITVKNFEELYYDMFRMISYVENKGAEPGSKMIAKYDNNYGTLLLLLAALYCHYEVFFLTKDYTLENVQKYDFFCGNGFIESLLKPKSCIKSINIKNYIYGDKDEIGFGNKGIFKFEIPSKNNIYILKDNELNFYYNIMKTNLSRANQIECMICDDIIQTLINVFCGIPTFIINNNGLTLGYKTIIDGVVNSCFLSKKNLMKIDDKKELIKTVFYRFNDIDNFEEKFNKAEFIEIKYGSLGESE